jgi:dihydrofolate reductase
MSKLRFRISMSLDGFIAGPNQGREHPLGVGGDRLHEWAYPLRAFKEMHGKEGGEVNDSNAIIENAFKDIGASIMGRNMFGGYPGSVGRA